MRGSLLPRLIDSLDGGCVDVMVDFETAPSPRITVVRYAGFPCERMHVTVPNAPDLGLLHLLLHPSYLLTFYFLTTSLQKNS